MSDRRWPTVLAVLGFVIAAAVLVLAMTRVIPWIWVSVVTVCCGVAAGVRWWRDRRSQLVAEMTAATAVRGADAGGRADGSLTDLAKWDKDTRS